MAKLSKAEMYALMDRWEVAPPILARVMVAGSWAESEWNTDARGDWRQEFPCSIGLFQLNRCGGLGQGRAEAELQDPSVQMEIMVPVYRREYLRWSVNYGGEDLAWRVCAWAERPRDYQNPDSAAAHRYREGWRRAARDDEEAAVADLTFPIAGPCSYGDRHWDGLLAVDVFAARDTPIVAMVSGYVEVANYPLGGHTVTLCGDNGWDIYHAHLVEGSGRGGRVRAGQQIGLVDNTGNARTTPPHCHLAIATRARGIDNDGAGDVNPIPILRRIQPGPQPGGPRPSCEEQLAIERSWGSAILNDVIRPSREQLQAVRDHLAPTRRPSQVLLDQLDGIIANLQRHEA